MRSPTAPLPLAEGQRDVLEKLARSHTAKHRDVQRAGALLLAADGTRRPVLEPPEPEAHWLRVVVCAVHSRERAPDAAGSTSASRQQTTEFGANQRNLITRRDTRL
jgi:hypothetical protein